MASDANAAIGSVVIRICAGDDREDHRNSDTGRGANQHRFSDVVQIAAAVRFMALKAVQLKGSLRPPGEALVGMGRYRRSIGAVVTTVAKSVALIGGRKEGGAGSGVGAVAGGAGVGEGRVAAMWTLGLNNKRQAEAQKYKSY